MASKHSMCRLDVGRGGQLTPLFQESVSGMLDMKLAAFLAWFESGLQSTQASFTSYTLGFTNWSSELYDLVWSSVSTVVKQYEVHREAEKRNQFSFVRIFFNAWQKLMIFFTYIKESMSYNSVHLILACVDNFV